MSAGRRRALATRTARTGVRRVEGHGMRLAPAGGRTEPMASCPVDPAGASCGRGGMADAPGLGPGPFGGGGSSPLVRTDARPPRSPGPARRRPTGPTTYERRRRWRPTGGPGGPRAPPGRRTRQFRGTGHRPRGGGGGGPGRPGGRLDGRRGADGRRRRGHPRGGGRRGPADRGGRAAGGHRRRRVAPAHPARRPAARPSSRWPGRPAAPWSPPAGDDPVRATTTGVGQLVLAAVDAGARRIVVAVGGSATTDGGWGAVEVIGSPARWAGPSWWWPATCAPLSPTPPPSSAPRRAPTPDQVAVLPARLESLPALPARVRRRRGRPGRRRGGRGLAGGLAALGARLVPGFDLVAELVAWPPPGPRRPGGDRRGPPRPPVLRGQGGGRGAGLVAGRAPVLCVAGRGRPGGAAEPPGAARRLEVVSLTDGPGPPRARHRPVALVAERSPGALDGRLARPA